MKTVDEIKESHSKMIQEWEAKGLPVSCLPELHMDRKLLIEYIEILEEIIRRKDQQRDYLQVKYDTVRQTMGIHQPERVDYRDAFVDGKKLLDIIVSLV